MEYLDMLAKLGIGNAHPGGFAATLRQLEQYALPPRSRILEVGCGTGRTSCYAAAQGHEVTGLDIRPEMISKARLRAAKDRVPVTFLPGDATDLPFPDASFDVVLAESVSIFTDTAKALSEYIRVLRPGGRLYDREMVLRQPVTSAMEAEMIRFYGVDRLMDVQEWELLLPASGFGSWHIDGPYPFPEISEDLTEHPDPHQEIDAGSFLDPELWEVTARYHEIMKRYHDHIGYILAVGTKRG